MGYDYFYEEQSEQFAFYKVPKVLFVNQEFRELSSDAKLLYGLLLDRTSLSKRNNWLDKNGRVYVIYTNSGIQYSLGCSDKKATKLLVELENQGLIERKKRGLGKPDLIYVKNFIRSSELRFQSRNSYDSGSVITTCQEPLKVRCNNTEKNNIEYSETDLIHPEDEMDQRNVVRRYFMEQLSFDYLQQQYTYQKQTLEELLELIVDTVCSNRKTIQIAGDSKPLEVVKSRFMKLDSSHIQYVMDCLEKNATDVRNIKQYLLASLYNASLTISSYYTAMFNNDHANGRI